MSLFDHSQYVSMTMEFRCNLHCEHCMIEGTMDYLVPESVDSFKKLLEYNQKERAWTGLILTGSEITLFNNLPERFLKRVRAEGQSCSDLVWEHQKPKECLANWRPRSRHSVWYLLGCRRSRNEVRD